MWTQVSPRNQISMREGVILRAKTAQLRTCLDMSGGQYTQSNSAGGSNGRVQMSTGVY